MEDMELMFQDLRSLLPILGSYEHVEGSLNVVCKLFPCRDLWVVCTQRFVGPTAQPSSLGASTHRAYVATRQAGVFIRWVHLLPHVGCMSHQSGWSKGSPTSLPKVDEHLRILSWTSNEVHSSRQIRKTFLWTKMPLLLSTTTGRLHAFKELSCKVAIRGCLHPPMLMFLIMILVFVKLYSLVTPLL